MRQRYIIFGAFSPSLELHTQNEKCEMHELRKLNTISHLRLNLPMHLIFDAVAKKYALV